MKKLCDFIGKEVLVFHLENRLEMNFEDGEIKIDTESNMWRIICNNKIIASTRDTFIFLDESMSVKGIAGDLIETEEFENDDFDYAEVIYERLENHRDVKLKDCEGLIENAKLIDVTEVIPNDFVFTFDNGTVLQVYSMVQKNTPLIEIR